MNITDIWTKIKSFLNSKTGELVIILLVLIASNIASFYIGKNTGNTPNNDNSRSEYAQIQTNDYSLADPVYKTGSFAMAAYKSSKTAPQSPEIAQNGEVVVNTTNSGNIATSPRYVANKNGRVYYYTWCSGAKNIKDDMRRYFNSGADARAAGYTPSKACAGLD